MDYGGAFNPIWLVSLKKRRETKTRRPREDIKIHGHRGKTTMWRQGQRLELCNYKPKHSWGHQKTEDIKTDSPRGALEIAWPCQHLDFGCLVSRTVEKKNSILKKHSIWGTLLGEPQETKLPALWATHSTVLPLCHQKWNLHSQTGKQGVSLGQGHKPSPTIKTDNHHQIFEEN